MNEATFLEQIGLRVSTEHLERVRAILSTEEDKERAQQGRGDTELMRVCCAALFNAGVAADSLVIWRAKTASMDADASIDVQLLCGAGFRRTLEWLERRTDSEAEAAMERISASAAAGDFEGFDPKRFGEQLEAYYSEEYE